MYIEQDHERLRRFVVTGVIFLLLILLIMINSTGLQLFDSLLQQFFSADTSSFKDLFFKAITFAGKPVLGIIYVVIIAFLLWGFKHKITSVWALGTLAGADIVGTVVKHIVKRARPFDHLPADDGYSFPSGHVLTMFTVVAILFLVVFPLIKKRALRLTLETLAVIYLILLAISRVYLHAHYPMDTIGAMILGYLWLQIAEWLYVWLAPTLQQLGIFRHSDI